jgi:hypothetical protein
MSKRWLSWEAQLESYEPHLVRSLYYFKAYRISLLSPIAPTYPPTSVLWQVWKRLRRKSESPQSRNLVSLIVVSEGDPEEVEGKTQLQKNGAWHHRLTTFLAEHLHLGTARAPAT